MLAKFAETPTQQKLALVALAVVGIAVGYYYGFYEDQMRAINGYRSRISELDKALLEKQAIANDLPRFRREVERLNQRLKEALSLLPNTADIPDLLTKVAEQAEKSGLALRKFELDDEIPKQFYAEVPVTMEVEGSYQELAVFFDKISKLPRIVSIANVSLQNPTSKTQRVIVAAKFNATTYRFLEQAPAQKTEGQP